MARRRKRKPRSSRNVLRRLGQIGRASRRAGSRAVRVLRRAPLLVQFLAVSLAAVLLWLPLNWAYQVVRKPSELLFPVSGALYKTPQETWRVYAPLFRRHSTDVITPPFLAALAQVEGSGNPVVRTYWRWSLTHRPFEIYRPASSAVGMYQITDGTFAEARRYCIRNHTVAEDGPWHAWRTCWLTALYTRVVPSHAVELTSAYLHRHAERLVHRHGLSSATVRQRRDLAAVIHLCGVGGAASYARRGLRANGQRCGDHHVAAYLAKVRALENVFAELAAAERRGD